MAVYQSKDHCQLYILPILLQSNLALCLFHYQLADMFHQLYLSMVYQFRQQL
nr:MAG TPA: hypothetical protein [Caudoviricetes sp.]